MSDSSKSSGAGSSKATGTSWINSIQPAMDALTAGVNSLFSKLDDPMLSTQAGQEVVEESNHDSAVLRGAEKAKYYEHVSVEELEGRIKGLKARLKRDPPEAMKKAIPVLIAELEAELDKKGC